jgi:hypothetical protein
MQATQSSTASGVVGVRKVLDAQGTWDQDGAALGEVSRGLQFGLGVAEGVQP